MSKAFLFTMATFVMITSVLMVIANFNERQADFTESMSEETIGYRIYQTWSDVEEALLPMMDFEIVVDGDVVTIYDNLPKIHDMGTLLDNYGKFIENIYEPTNVDIKFLSVDGTPILLSEIPDYLEIIPLGIIYDYPFYGHNELTLTVPNENFTSVDSIILDIKVTNKNITEEQWKWSPYKPCSGDDCIKITVTLRDNYMAYTFPENSFSRIQQSKTQADLSGAGWVEVIVGSQTSDTQLLFKVVMHNAQADAATSLLLNTTEFSVVYPAKLSVEDLNYNISKEDWF